MKILRIPLVIVLIVVAGRTFDADAQTGTNLYSFVGSPTDGLNPFAGLVQGSDGSFYGTTYGGGTSTNCGGFGCGTVFRISPSGSETNLYSFVGSPTDGANPWARLVQGSDGNFYGTTARGGTSTNCSGGCGTVFRISPGGSYTNLHSFNGSPTDGYQPLAGLVQGSDGNFFGTTQQGGASDVGAGGLGTVFRISASGIYTTLYSFGSYPNDGEESSAGLVQGSDGNFYGTTEGGGVNSQGTVFRISPSGTYTTLYSFVGYPDGSDPQVGLVQGSDGNFYGTTHFGGTATSGTVFRISSSGTETNLHSFVGSLTDGYYPAGLVQGSDGNFYGTTQQGGASTDCGGPGFGCGTVFRISPGGSYTNLYSFGSYPNDGSGPDDELVQASDGNFYGTADLGGTHGYGTVFKFSVPLNSPPYPINQITSVHHAATNLVFTIVSIAGETYQLQFSSSLTPTNWINVPGVSITNSIGSILTLTNFAGANQSQGFYRFAITP